jgi:hemolysin III
MTPPEPLHPHAIRWHYSAAEIWADGVVHVLGLVMAFGASLVLLLKLGGWDLPGLEIAAVGTYLATLLASLGISAVYNLWPVSRAKWILRRFDHSAIFLLIAGTYSPFMARLEMWWMLGFVWLAAGLGVAFKLSAPGRFPRLSVLFYLALGWTGIFAYQTLGAELPALVLWLIFGGGLAYSFGVVFHIADRMRFHNAVWHGFVLAGAGLHFGAVFALAMAA